MDSSIFEYIWHMITSLQGNNKQTNEKWWSVPSNMFFYLARNKLHKKVGIG